MRLVIALGGNALLRRGEPMTIEHQRKNVRVACEQIAKVVMNQKNHEIVIVHGNGPQVGLLALQGTAYDPQHPYPLDVLGAETEGMIGYLIEQELGNAIFRNQQQALVVASDNNSDKLVPIATMLTQVEVEETDPAFTKPSKPIGPVYTATEVEQLKQERAQQQLKAWTFVTEGEKVRRVVPSPKPKRIVVLQPVRWLLAQGCVVICAGGGGIPAINRDGILEGVEAVVDKDLCAALLARQLQADLLLIATDVDGVYIDWGKPTQQRISRVTPDELNQFSFAAGSMGPKVEAACEFVRQTKKRCVIGTLADIENMLEGKAGTEIKISIRK
jgi:carbamate kinase